MVGAPATNAAKRVRVSKTVLECLKRVFSLRIFVSIKFYLFGLFLTVLKLLSAVFWVPLLLVNCWNTGGEARMYYPSTWPAGCLWSCLHSTGSIWERLVLRWSWTMYCYLYLSAKIFPQHHGCAEYTVGYAFAFVKKLLQLLYWYIYYISSISSFLKSAPRLRRNDYHLQLDHVLSTKVRSYHILFRPNLNLIDNSISSFYQRKKNSLCTAIP